MGRTEEPLESLVSELRRGTLVLCVLSQLQERQYGYSLSQLLAEKGMEVDQGTLYPLLRRLEKQELLGSDWEIEESRPRRYYILNERGRALLGELEAQWREIVKVMDNMIREEGGVE